MSKTKKPVEETGAIEAMLSPLYQLAGDYLALVQEVQTAAEEGGGVIPEELDKRWEQIEGSINAKLANCCMVAETMERQEANIKAEIDRLKAIMATCKKSRERFLQGYVLRQMDRVGVEEGGVPEHFLKVRTNPPGVDDDALEGDQIPDEFCNYTLTIPGDQMATLLWAIDFAKEAAEEAPSSERSSTEDDVLQLRPERWAAKRSVRKKDVVDLWKRTSGANEVPGAPVRQRRVLKRIG